MVHSELLGTKATGGPGPCQPPGLPWSQCSSALCYCSAPLLSFLFLLARSAWEHCLVSVQTEDGCDFSMQQNQRDFKLTLPRPQCIIIPREPVLTFPFIDLASGM